MLYSSFLHGTAQKDKHTWELGSGLIICVYILQHLLKSKRVPMHYSPIRVISGST